MKVRVEVWYTTGEPSKKLIFNSHKELDNYVYNRDNNVCAWETISKRTFEKTY